MEIYIPVTSIRSKPCEVFLSGLYVVIGPKGNGGPDSEEALHAVKMNRLKAADLFGLDKTKRFNNLDSKDSKVSWSDKMLNRVVMNIKFHVENVHIRYEDNMNNVQPFSFGVTIQSFSAYTVDVLGNPYFLKDIIKGELRKLLNIKFLSVYLNNEENNVKVDEKSEGLAEFITRMKRYIYRDDNKIRLEYILHPFSSQMKYFQSDSGEESQLPYRTLDFILGRHYLSLNYLQYCCLMELMKYFDMKLKFKEYFVPRPISRPSRSPRDWWIYLFKCISKETEHKRNAKKWSYVQQYQRNWKTYIKLYERKLMKDTLSRLERDELNRLEREMRFDDIIYYRKMASAALLLNKEKKYRRKNESEFLSDLYAALKVDENEALMDENDQPSFMKMQLKFDLQEGSLSLKKRAEDKHFSALKYSNVNFYVAIRKSGSISTGGYIGIIRLDGKHSADNILLMQATQNISTSHAISWEVHTKSSLTDSWNEEDLVDLRVTVSSQPFRLRLRQQFVEEMQSFFLTSSYTIKDAADIVFSLMKRKAEYHLKEVIKDNPTMILDIHLPVPHIILDLRNDLMFVLKLGDSKFQGNNTLRERSMPQDLNDPDIMKELAYDTFLFKTKDIHAYILQGSAKIPLIGKFDMVLLMKVLTAQIEDLPMFQFDFFLNDIQVNFSKIIATNLITLANVIGDIRNRGTREVYVKHMKEGKDDLLDFELDEDKSSIIPYEKELKAGICVNMENYSFTLHDENGPVCVLNARSANVELSLGREIIISNVQLRSFSIIDHYIVRNNSIEVSSQVNYIIQSSERDPVLSVLFKSDMKQHDIDISMGCVDFYLNRPTIAYTATLISEYILLIEKEAYAEDIKELLEKDAPKEIGRAHV